MAQIEQNESKLADLRLKNADSYQGIIDKISLKQTELTTAQKKLDEAKAKNDQKNAQKYLSQIEKINLQILKLDQDRIRSAERGKRAEEKLTKQIEKQKAEYSSLSKKIQKVGDAFTGLVGVVSVGAVVGKFNQIVDSLDAIGKRARDIGLTASQLQEFQHQANLSGIEASKLDVSLKAFRRNISLASTGTGEAKASLEAMGIALKDANGKTREQGEILKEVARYFSQHAGEMENAGRASRIFGESGAELLRIFEQGEGVIDEVFNARKIDQASLSAEAYKDSLENLNNFITTRLMVSAGKLADILESTVDKDNYYQSIAKNSLSIVEKITNKTRQELVKISAEIKKVEEALGKTDKYTFDAYSGQKVNAEYDKMKQKLEELKQKRRDLQEQGAKEINQANEQSRINEKVKKDTAELNERLIQQEKIRVSEEERMHDLLIEEVKALEKQEEIEAKRNLAESEKKKSQLEAKKSKLETQAQSRKDFELETKIEVLKKQGRTKEAEALEFAKKRNELMVKYGYSIDQATRVQKTLNALQKGEGGLKYSDEAKKKAERIIAKGEKGTIGKRDLEEAKAIVEGRAVEGGFKSAMFQKYKDAKAPTFKDININSKATKEQLDKESQKLEKESADALKNVEAELVGLNALIKELKSSVDLIATKENKIAQ